MSIKKAKAIGIFDTGFGGLTIMREIVKQLPEYKYIYLGDTARVPYGTRSDDLIYNFTKQAIDFFFKRECDLVVLACNTVSGNALGKIQREYLPKVYPDKKVLGVIVPTAESAALKTKNKKIGVIATSRTVLSGAFEKELLKIDPKIQVFQNASPLLSLIIEQGEHNSKAVDIFIKKYLKPLINEKIDTLILGCTHYGILESKIKKIAGKKIVVISEAGIVAKKLKNYLQRHPEIETKLNRNGERIFYSTDITEGFNILGSKFFGQKIKVRKAQLE